METLPKSLSAFHPEWGSVATIRFLAHDRVLRVGKNDIATLLKLTDNKLVLRWDDYGIETFINDGSGVYRYAADEKYELPEG